MKWMRGFVITVGLIWAAAPARASDMDRLLDLLTQKGTITRQEADALRKQVAADQAASAAKPSEPPVTARSRSRFSGYTQARLQSGPALSDTAEIRRARLVFSGSVAPNWDYRIMADFGGAGRKVIESLGTNGGAAKTTSAQKPILLDATLVHRLTSTGQLTVGQFKVPFSQENLISSSDLETINRSQVVEQLVPGRDIGSQGRNIGLMLDGGAPVKNDSRRLAYAVGLFNGTGINAADANDQKDVAARLALAPAAGLSVGVSGYRGRFGPKSTDRDRLGFELAWLQPRYLVKAEYVNGKDDRTKKHGWYVLGGCTVGPHLQAVLRWDEFDPNTAAGDDRIRVATLGVNWFLNPAVKLQVNYEKHDEQGHEVSNDLVLSQLQVRY